MREQKDAGLYVVPQSLNLSRTDFDMCDIVEEVRRRVDENGILRDKLTIEITESCVGSDFAFMKEQVERFHSLGFQVWMDDFGSGYSSLDVLQEVHFDLIKFDMRFMHRFGEGDESRIILTELMKMAIGLGVETITEGVETQEQVDFLREVGCTKLQGYYYGRAVSLAEIVERNRKGIQIGYENPDETGYYTIIGRINLYDPASLSDSGERFGNYFETFPMAVIESNAESIRILRCNKAYREFLERYFTGGIPAENLDIPVLQFGAGRPFAQAVAQCRETEGQVFIDEMLADGTNIHAMFRHVAENPVNGVSSCIVVIWNSAEPRQIAQPGHA